MEKVVERERSRKRSCLLHHWSKDTGWRGIGVHCAKPPLLLHCHSSSSPTQLRWVRCFRTYVFHLLGLYVNILCNWLIFWQNALYLYLGRSKMFLILQEIKFQDQVLKSSSLSKKTSWKCKFIKTRQLARQLHLLSLRKLFQPSVLDTSYLSRFKKFKILIWFSWNPWMCLWAFFSPNPRHIKGLF